MQDALIATQPVGLDQVGAAVPVHIAHADEQPRARTAGGQAEDEFQVGEGVIRLGRLDDQVRPWCCRAAPCGHLGT